MPNFIRNGVEKGKRGLQIGRCEPQRHRLRPLVDIRTHKFKSSLNSDFQLVGSSQIFKIQNLTAFVFFFITINIFYHTFMPTFHCKLDNIIWPIFQNSSCHTWQFKVSTRCRNCRIVETLMLCMKETSLDQFVIDITLSRKVPSLNNKTGLFN